MSMQGGQRLETVPKDGKNLTFLSFGGLDTPPVSCSPADGHILYGSEEQCSVQTPPHAASSAPSSHFMAHSNTDYHNCYLYTNAPPNPEASVVI